MVIYNQYGIIRRRRALAHRVFTANESPPVGRTAAKQPTHPGGGFFLKARPGFEKTKKIPNLNER